MRSCAPRDVAGVSLKQSGCREAPGRSPPYFIQALAIDLQATPSSARLRPRRSVSLLRRAGRWLESPMDGRPWPSCPDGAALQWRYALEGRSPQAMFFASSAPSRLAPARASGTVQTALTASPAAGVPPRWCCFLAFRGCPCFAAAASRPGRRCDRGATAVLLPRHGSREHALGRGDCRKPRAFSAPPQAVPGAPA
jgi:hypothetical protein